MPKFEWWRRVLFLLAVVVGVCLLLAHVRAYYSGAGGGVAATLIQVSAADATSDLLAERQPMVLMDALVVPDHQALMRTLFRWQYLVARRRVGVSDGFAAARFTLLTSFSSDAAAAAPVVSISCGSTAVDVRLARGRTLVLPPRWAWRSAGAELLESALHDPVTLLLSALRC